MVNIVNLKIKVYIIPQTGFFKSTQCYVTLSNSFQASDVTMGTESENFI